MLEITILQKRNKLQHVYILNVFKSTFLGNDAAGLISSSTWLQRLGIDLHISQFKIKTNLQLDFLHSPSCCLPLSPIARKILSIADQQGVPSLDTPNEFLWCQYRNAQTSQWHTKCKLWLNNGCRVIDKMATIYYRVLVVYHKVVPAIISLLAK